MSGLSTLIAPTPEAERAVGSWRSRFDPWAKRGVPAHITLLEPFLFPSQLGDGARERLALLLNKHQQTEIELSRVEQLPGAVSLLPDNAKVLWQITRDLFDEWPELEARSRTGRGRPYHVTIACMEEPHLFDEIRIDVAGFLPIRTRICDVRLLTAQSDGMVAEIARFGFQDPQAELS
ncbi:MAG: 2'-5' RNA ligase family protein [Gaiellaceae bacterium]